jgi:nucleotide-binding universal stress UspA family protein
MKYKILVLSDLNKSVSKTLLSSVSLAKIVNAKINFLYVKKPTDVVEQDSQLSAMRTINQEYFSIDKKIKELIKPISESYNVAINHTFTIGNIKNEIEKYIDENKPDIIVLGKKKSRIVSFLGDNITQFILNKHNGAIVIADENNVLEPNKELSLGLFNSINTSNSFVAKIIASTQKPLKSFKILESSTNSEKVLNDEKIVEYVFEKGDNVIKNISNYLTKSNVNLLFVNRQNQSEKSLKLNIKDVINDLDCSLFLTK